MHVVDVRALTKRYRVPVRGTGLAAAFGSLIRRSHEVVEAVRELSFTVGEGEMLGFLGPNGAGKTTTLKILAGLLFPTAGQVSVLGHTPWQRRREYLRQVAMVLGNKSQLTWDIPARDSFEVLREIYRVPQDVFRRTTAELIDLLDAGALLAKPVRTLSLGERMKCELIAAFLHRPRLVFLDEPTLGLDVTMQRRLREFVKARNADGVTVLLTSHYMADVQALFRRVVLIGDGSLVFDGTLDELSAQVAPFKVVSVTTQTPPPAWPQLPSWGMIVQLAWLMQNPVQKSH